MRTIQWPEYTDAPAQAIIYDPTRDRPFSQASIKHAQHLVFKLTLQNGKGHTDFYRHEIDHQRN